MRVQALCCASFERSVKRAANVDPLLSPPVTVETFNPAVLQGYDLLYVKLHGLPGQPYWYGDEWITATSAEQVCKTDLHGATVYAPTCFLPQSPMLAALFEAGAEYVIGGEDENYERTVDRFGRIIRLLMQTGLSVETSFRLAKLRLRITPQTLAVRDTLNFRLYKDGVCIS